MPEPSQTRKILLIDDDRMQFRVTQQLFKSFRGEQYDLEWASTYEEGIDKLMGGGYVACLLDYQLGPRDGLVLIREAVGRGCRVPIIFLTAESGEKVDIEAMNAGALDYLVKGEINARMLERSLRYALKLGDTLEELRRLATRDQLTGLFNRREFERMLQVQKSQADSAKTEFSLVLVDIDHFKRVNDQHGHPAGDEVLREIARRLLGAVRGNDQVARIGGEEFAVTMPGTPKQAAAAVARRLSESVRSRPIVVREGLELPITLSVGVANHPADVSAKADIVMAADKALYEAKTAGRDRVVLAGGA
ncbi:MAG TPA: diguanylate cyclase [Opitutaceae bacterium]|nr:diguanylate cyclase [Opitutaceae bacterium]